MCEVRVRNVSFFAGERDLKGGVLRRIIEHVEPTLVHASSLTKLEKYAVSSIYEFSIAMHQIASKIQTDGAPLLNFYFHGSPEHGLLMQSGEYVSWGLLNELLRNINMQCANSICVLSLACHSFKSIKHPNMYKAAPYSVLFAPSDEVYEGEIENEVQQFYSDLLRGGHLDNASRHMKSFNRFIPERYVREAAEKAIKATHGRSGALERDAYLSRAIEKFPELDKSRYRKILKNHGKKNPEDVIKEMCKVYMCGREFCPALLNAGKST